MFSRVVSNFRRKSKSSRKLKSSISSPEIKSCPSTSGQKLVSKFNSDETLSAALSIIDNDDNSQKQTQNASLEVDYQRESVSGANFCLINQYKKKIKLLHEKK